MSVQLDNHLGLFSEREKKQIKKNIFFKNARGKETAFVNCIVRNKPVQCKPEEVVRQLYAQRLIHEYGFPKSRLAFEHSVNSGREKKKADIVVFDKDRADTPYIIVELKKPQRRKKPASLLLQCNRCAYRRKRRANFVLSPQRPKLF